MKKVLIVFLVFAYLHCYLGCTKTVFKEYPISDLGSAVRSARAGSQIIIVIKDSTMIEIQAQTCRVINDTLIGKLKIGGGEAEHYSIALSDIDSIAIPDKETTVTGYIVGGIGVIGVAVGLWYLLIKMIESMTPEFK